MLRPKPDYNLKVYCNLLPNHSTLINYAFMHSMINYAFIFYFSFAVKHVAVEHLPMLEKFETKRLSKTATLPFHKMRSKSTLDLATRKTPRTTVENVSFEFARMFVHVE